MFLIKEKFILKSYDNVYNQYILKKIKIYFNHEFIKSNFVVFKKTLFDNPKTKRRFSVLRSPHVNNKSHEQFEIQTQTTTFSLFYFFNEKKFCLLSDFVGSRLFRHLFSFNSKLRIFHTVRKYPKMEYSQEVRHRFLISRYRGSNPLTPR